jgi:tRNA uridine 5-carbamoylmethylation protein Kti12
MNDTQVLVLNGSPGSGKSTLANAVAEHLRLLDVAHAVIDLDEVARIYPERNIPLIWDNLRAVWPNYSAIPNLKVILPVCIDSNRDLEVLRSATPCGEFTICELVADASILKARVTNREPNEYWRSKLRNLVEKYISKASAERFGDFQVRTDDKSIEDATKNIIERVGWEVVET